MSNTEFASASLTAGQLNAIVKKLGGPERARQFLRGELVVSEPTRNWLVQDGVIYFCVTSDGTTGPEWITRFEGRGIYVDDHVRWLLTWRDFKPTTGVLTWVAVIKGESFEDGNGISLCDIRTEAKKRKLSEPNAEVACLIREKFSDKELESMGLAWIVAMHEPFKGVYGTSPCFLCVCRLGCGSHLTTCRDGSTAISERRSGFAFVFEQSKPDFDAQEALSE